MVNKCPPGVFCIENVTLMILFIIISFIYLYFYFSLKKTIYNNNYYIKKTSQPMLNKEFNDFLNPLNPPLRNDNIYNMPNRVPINISTSSVNSNYRQIGILTNESEHILPLMGKPLHTRRDKWNFYTLNDKHNMIKLPIKHNNRSCTSEIGCDNLYTGDTVFVEGYNQPFKVTTYDNKTMEYLPFL